MLRFPSTEVKNRRDGLDKKSSLKLSFTLTLVKTQDTC